MHPTEEYAGFAPTWADGIVLAGSILLLGYLYLHYWGGEDGRAARFAHIAGGAHGPVELDLARGSARQVEIAGRLGPTLIQVETGRVRFLASPCAGKQCVRAGWLELNGDFAACLPNGISIQIMDHSGQANRFDSLVF